MKASFEIPAIEVVSLRALSGPKPGPCCYDGHDCD